MLVPISEDTASVGIIVTSNVVLVVLVFFFFEVVVSVVLNCVVSVILLIVVGNVSENIDVWVKSEIKRLVPTSEDPASVEIVFESDIVVVFFFFFEVEGSAEFDCVITSIPLVIVEGNAIKNIDV